MRYVQTPDGPVTVVDVPEGRYSVSAEAPPIPGEGIAAVGQSSTYVDIRAGREVNLELYTAVTGLSNQTFGNPGPADIWFVESDTGSPVVGRPSGKATLYRYHLDALHVGTRYDRVTRVVPTYGFSRASESGAGLSVSIYRIPDNVAWPGPAVTYETFNSLVPEATYPFEYRLNQSAGDAGRYTGCAHPAFDPAFFFSARNGFAVVIRDDGRGEGINVFPDLGPLEIDYPWQKESADGPPRFTGCFL